jgi:beta-N-acetylhexosaminidase
VTEQGAHATAGLSRRGFLKRGIALAAAAPVVLSSRDAAAATDRVRRAARAATGAALTSQQTAGQRVIYSYPGLTVPSA